MAHEVSLSDRAELIRQLIDERLEAYQAGVIAESVGTLALSKVAVGAVPHLLLERGFRFQYERRLAGCTPAGAPQWCRRDGTASSDPADRELVVIESWVHRDGGAVKVYRDGDPLGREAPPRIPSARKGVLMLLPVLRREEDREIFFANGSLRNWAFLLSDDGDPLPKELRHAGAFARTQRREPPTAKQRYEQAEDMRKRAIILLSPSNGARG